MAMELWKLQRELLRFGKQVREFPEDLINYFFATRRYDRTRLDQIRMFDGKLPKSDRIAIFLIFPQTGLLQSHLHTLEYFRSKGYATLVVSNLPLSESDRKRLAENCWQIMERPNFGYDFGGYRDGVLHLSEDLQVLERLVLINDSVWFPLPGGRDWLNDVEALDVDFAGAASNYSTPRPKVNAFRSLKWSYSTNHSNFHICSFALCLRSKLFADEQFLQFWRNLSLSNKKNRTVRCGEIGLTQWVLRMGLSFGTTLNLKNLDCELNLLPMARLYEVAKNLIIFQNDELKYLLINIIKNSKTSKEDLEKFILLAASRQGATYALATYLCTERNFPFLKKSPIKSSNDFKSVYLRSIKNERILEYIKAEFRE